MAELTSEAIERIIDRQLGLSGCPGDFPALPEVPAARYYDPGFAALEMEHVWLKSWLMAGLASEVPDAGNFKLFERLGRSVIIVRGKDGAIRAFHNVCRHRGSAVVTEPEGTAARFVCPYHGWTYGTEGQLLAVPEPGNFPCLDKAGKGLVPVRCETWRGLLFINFDLGGEPLETYLASAAGQAASFPFERFAVKNRKLISIDCNWKVGIDNTLETYHVNQLHPQTIAPFLDTPSFSVGLLDNGHSRFVARKKSTTIMAPEQEVENVAGPMFADYNICVKVFPSNFYLFDATGFVYHVYWPDGPGRCLVEFVQCGPAATDSAYYEQMFTVMEPVLQEDWRLFPAMQRAIESGASPTMRLSYQERAIYWLQQEIDRRIGPERIPAHLRIDPVLAEFAER